MGAARRARCTVGGIGKDGVMQIFLETERLILRWFTEADAQNLLELDSDPAVMRYLNGGVATPRELVEREILPRFLSYYERYDGFGVWAAVEKSSGAFIGWFSLRPHEESRQNEMELGYRLRRLVWGQGYATEGARALIRKGFTELGVERVTASTYEHNSASRRVMAKAGMTLVRRYRPTLDELASKKGNHLSADSVWDGDEVEYALAKADWERQETRAATGRNEHDMRSR
jgi:RimJ/RimL family protein N-acetyltransferase